MGHSPYPKLYIGTKSHIVYYKRLKDSTNKKPTHYKTSSDSDSSDCIKETKLSKKLSNIEKYSNSRNGYDGRDGCDGEIGSTCCTVL